MEPYSRTSPLDRAIVQFGSLAALALTLRRLTGQTLTPQGIQKWRDVRRVPDRWWLSIEEATGQRVMAYEFLLWHAGHEDPRPIMRRHYERYMASVPNDEEAAA